MIAALAEWNAARAAAGEEPLAIGIGEHYGAAVIGDVGTEQSLSFTVIGDTVNTASRLQALTRSLAAPVVASDAVVSAARGSAAAEVARLIEGLRDHGDQAVRGRSGAVRIWTRPAASAVDLTARDDR